MPIKYFYLQNADSQFINVKYNHNNKLKISNSLHCLSMIHELNYSELKDFHKYILL